MKKTVILAVLGFYLSTTAGLAFEKEDLNGKWEGTSVLGDLLRLTLKVDGNTISGDGQAPPRGKHKVFSANVEGKVDGNNVVISTYSGRNQTRVTYHCSWEEPKVLNCHARAKNFDTQFKKLD